MILLWSISFLVVLIFLSNFLTNYLKSLDIENDHNSPDAFGNLPMIIMIRMNLINRFQK